MFKMFLSLVLTVSLVGCCTKQGDISCHEQKPKYIFLFIGDGMGVGQRAVAEKSGALLMNALPVKALVKTSAYGGGVTDSAASATAFACGEKTRNAILGLDHTGKSIESVAELAKKSGWKVGIVSSAPLNHATPAGFYAHRLKRNMYNEIIQDLAVSNFDYFGGASFIIKKKKQEVLKALKDNNYIMLKSSKKMVSLDPDKKYIVHSTMPYAIDRNKKSGLTLADYTRLGIKHIYTGAGKTKGFFMMVEGGRIDWAGHANDGGSVIPEVKDLDDALRVALDFYKKHPKSTCIIITADHETGGLQLLKKLNTEKLLGQKRSYGYVNYNLRKYKKEKLSLEKVLPFLQENYSIKQFSPEELEKLHQVWNFKETKPKKTYDKYNALLRCVQDLFNKRGGIKWSTRGHTGAAVPLTAIGIDSKLFDGSYENIQIARKLKYLIEPCAKK